MPDASDTPDLHIVAGHPLGSLSMAISNAVVGLVHDYTGRGPGHARTTIGPDTIVVTLRDSLTKAERTLARRGQAVEVLAIAPRLSEHDARRHDRGRRAAHRPDRRSIPERQLHEPDVAVEIFLMHRSNGDGHRGRSLSLTPSHAHDELTRASLRGGAAARVDCVAMYADQVLAGAQRSTTQDAQPDPSCGRR
jgi:hypothetical protein